MKVLQIDHVELFVPDPYDAARWYQRVLGLDLVPGTEGWATGGGPLMISSDGGRTKLALFQGQPTTAPQTAAFRRVAFSATGDGFLEFLERRKEFGFTSSVVDHDQAFSIYFTDPWGHLLEVTTYEHERVRRAMGQQERR